MLRREPHRVKCAWRGAQALVALGQPLGALEMLDAFEREVRNGAASPSAAERTALEQVRQEAVAMHASGDADRRARAAMVSDEKTSPVATVAEMPLRGVQGSALPPRQEQRDSTQQQRNSTDSRAARDQADLD